MPLNVSSDAAIRQRSDFALSNKMESHNPRRMSLNWDGLYCALWTPTDSKGQLIEGALRSNLDFMRSRGVDGLLALGSTGEFLQLDPPKRQAMIEKVAKLSGSLRLMINVSDIQPGVVADLGRCARACGAAAISLLPPYFYPVAQCDLIEFFVRAAEAAQLPLFLYNFPERTGNRIALETIAAVAARVPVVGVKQSGSEFAYHKDLVALGKQTGFVVLTGADTRLGEAIPMGVSGCVSGLSNGVPELVSQALAAARCIPMATDAAPLVRMTEIARRIPAVHFPMDVAAVMQARDLTIGEFKPIVSPETREKFLRLVSELRELFQAWRLV